MIQELRFQNHLHRVVVKILKMFANVSKDFFLQTLTLYWNIRKHCIFEQLGQHEVKTFEDHTVGISTRWVQLVQLVQH